MLLIWTTDCALKCKAFVLLVRRQCEIKKYIITLSPMLFLLVRKGNPAVLECQMTGAIFVLNDHLQGVQ